MRWLRLGVDKTPLPARACTLHGRLDGLCSERVHYLRVVVPIERLEALFEPEPVQQDGRFRDGRSV